MVSCLRSDYKHFVLNLLYVGVIFCIYIFIENKVKQTKLNVYFFIFTSVDFFTAFQSEITSTFTFNPNQINFQCF